MLLRDFINDLINFVCVLIILEMYFYYWVGIVSDSCYVCCRRIDIEFVNNCFYKLFYLFLIFFFDIFRWVNNKSNVYDGEVFFFCLEELMEKKI